MGVSHKPWRLAWEELEGPWHSISITPHPLHAIEAGQIEKEFLFMCLNPVKWNWLNSVYLSVTSYGHLIPKFFDSSPLSRGHLCLSFLIWVGMWLFRPIKYGRRDVWLPRLGHTRPTSWPPCKKSDYPEATILWGSPSHKERPWVDIPADQPFLQVTPAQVPHMWTKMLPDDSIPGYHVISSL